MPSQNRWLINPSDGDSTTAVQAPSSLRQISIFSVILISLALGFSTVVMMQKAGVPHLGLTSVLMLCMGWLIVVTSGALAQNLLAPAIKDSSYAFAVSAGIVLSSLAVLALAELIRLNATVGLAVFGAVVLSVALWRHKHFTLALANIDLAVPLVVPGCAVFTLVWCWTSLESIGQMPVTGRVSLWMDCFIHATTILEYGDFRTLGRGSYQFVDAARPLYHYGSYVLPAAMLPLADISGLQAEAALHVPIGLIAMFTGTYALASQLAKPELARLSAFLAISLLFILPDTSTYGLANGWFGVRWILLSHSGSGYAISAILISLIFAKLWLETRHITYLAASIGFAAMTFELRAHLLMWYLPALTLCLLMGEPRFLNLVRNRVKYVPLALLALLPFSNVNSYLWFVHARNEPTGYSGVYQNILNTIGETLSAPIGYALLFPGMLGAFSLAYPAFFIAKHRAIKPKPIDWFPILLMVSAGLIILFSKASPNGDPYEFKHRAFILLYVVVLIWVVVMVIDFFSRKYGATVTVLGMYIIVSAFSILAMSNPVEFMNVDRPKFSWGAQYVDTKISKDLIASADFVRHHARLTDVAVQSPVDIKARAADDATRFASIANMPMYLSRYTVFDQVIAQGRLTLMKKIVNSMAYSEVSQQMRSTGFQWLIINSAEAPAFDPGFTRAVFRQGDWAVYSFDL